MPETRPLSIHLPPERADMVKSKIASGECAGAGDVVQDGLLSLQEHDDEVERWLRDEVAPTYEAWKANPERAKPLEEVAAWLNAFMVAAVMKANQV